MNPASAAPAEPSPIAPPPEVPPPRAPFAFWNTVPGWALTLLLVLVVGAVAAATRLPRLSSAPPGFLIDEAASGLYAQTINRNHLPIFFGGGTPDVQEPFFFYLLKWTGTLLGWDIVGARAAAALCGIGVAIACALWYARALGRIWGLAGGLLVATSFWQLMFSRQAIRPITAALFAPIGLWLLWFALTLPSHTKRHWRYLAYAAAGAAFGASFYTYISFRLIIIAAPLIAALLIHQRHHPLLPAGEGGKGSEVPTGLLITLLVMLAFMAPLAIYYMRHPDDFTSRVEQVRDDEGGVRLLDDPFSVATDYLATARSVVWDGYDSPNVNQPGRPIFDPLLAVWALAGFAVALRHPLRPLHGVALVWFAIFMLPAALSSPGHPGRMLTATPVVYLFPLLAMRAAAHWARQRGQAALTAAGLTIALTVAGSAVWSLHDYFRVWAPSQAAYVAFQGDVRASLEAIDALPDDGAPVYYSTWTLERLVEYLAPDRPRRDLDGRTTLAMPNERAGYFVYPDVTTPDPALMTYFESDPPVAVGRKPDGALAWQARRVDERVRERLPFVVPPIGLAGGFTLVGFDITPAPDTSANPRVAVTLVWRLPAGAPSQTARIRLVPVGTPPDDPPPTFTDTLVAASSPNLLGALDREIVVSRVLVDFPVSPDMLADVQLGLLGPDGAPLPPVSAPAAVSENYVQLNRVQYQLVTP